MCGLDNVTRIDSPSELASNEFDVVGSFDVLEHVDDDKRLLREFRRILKRNRFLFLTVPACRFLWGGEDLVSQHKRRYGKGELIEKT